MGKLRLMFFVDPSVGFGLSFEKPDEFDHRFCGPSPLATPDCDECRRPHLHFLSLDTRDSRLNLGAVKAAHVPLLFCWTCEGQDLSYHIASEGAVELLAPSSGFFTKGFPYAKYPLEFPGQRVGLTPVVDYQGTTDDLGLIRHQVGGRPFLWNVHETCCPRCQTEMPFLATVCDNAAGPDVESSSRKSRSFTQNSGVQVVYHLCRACAIVSAYHCCD